MNATWRQLSCDKDIAIATRSDCRSGFQQTSTCKLDENQAVFTAAEWPRLYGGFHRVSKLLTATNQEIPSWLKLQTFTQPITSARMWLQKKRFSWTTTNLDINNMWLGREKGIFLFLLHGTQLFKAFYKHSVQKGKSSLINKPHNQTWCLIYYALITDW